MIRLADMEAQMEFEFAKLVRLRVQQRNLQAQYDHLKELPVDTLKIDRAFVDGMEHSSQQEAIVKAIVVLGTSLSMRVVAEGVENDQQLDMLRELGCHLIQGYHISKPLKAEEMQRLLERQQNQVA